MNKIDGPFNPKYKKLQLRAYLLGTVSDVEIGKNDRDSLSAAPIQSDSKFQKWPIMSYYGSKWWA